MPPYAGIAESVSPPRRQIGVGVRRLALAYVWLTIASMGVVLFEPAPFDLLMLGAIGILPVVGLFAFGPQLAFYLVLWMLVIAGGLVAATQAVPMDTPTVHTLVTLFLALSSVAIAGFVAKAPVSHLRLLLSAYTTAAVVAALAGLAGYFSLLPGAYELFTEFGRAKGSFKDPNVFGAFLVPALLYAFNGLLTARPVRGLFWLALTSVLTLATLLSFSRGAWLNLGMGLLVFVFLAVLTAPSHRWRLKLVVYFLFGAGFLLGLLAFAVNTPQIAELLGERAALAQAYDVGPEGRFGGQIKALGLIVTHPLGIGALEFSANHHGEDVHNVYLSMFLNSGWIGGFAYLALILMTLGIGFSQAIRERAGDGVAVVLFAAFCGQAVVGLVVDTDHWRHFFVLMGLIWGNAFAVQWARSNATSPARLGPADFAATRQA